MSNDYDYFTVSETDKGVLKNIKNMGDRLIELKRACDDANEKYKQALKEYEHYANTVLPMQMYECGISEITLDDGSKMSCKTSYYCSPNKNKEDKEKMVAWLNEHGGGHLCKKWLEVGTDTEKILRENKVPFVESGSFDSRSIKAFLTSLIGAKGGVAQVSFEDIPKEFHFTKVDSVVIEA